MTASGPMLPPLGLASKPAPYFKHFDNLLNAKQQQEVLDFLDNKGWDYGSKSPPATHAYSFWHKHFAGARSPAKEKEYDCVEELQRSAPLMYAFWCHFKDTLWKEHTLVRCYANAYPYGTDGTLHTDSKSPTSFTSVYYPHKQWSPNWGGETVFLNHEETDVIGITYPKPNRLVAFAGAIPHVARGGSRICPVIRITLI